MSFHLDDTSSATAIFGDWPDGRNESDRADDRRDCLKDLNQTGGQSAKTPTVAFTLPGDDFVRRAGMGQQCSGERQADGGGGEKLGRHEWESNVCPRGEGHSPGGEEQAHEEMKNR